MSHGVETDLPITREQLLAFRHEPVHVVGAASAEGVAVLRLLLTLGFTDITVHDMRERDTLRKAFNTVHGAYSRVEQNEIWKAIKPTLDAGKYGADYLEGIEDAALVSLGQGWYLLEDSRAQLAARIPAEARVTSMSGLYFALHRGPIAGITGTNGKSTTTALAEHLLAEAGVAYLASGNERSSQQFLPRIDEIDQHTWALLEVSNRQLMQLADTSPNVAAITALTPDHLEEHGGWDGYRDTKARLFTSQSGDDVAIVNADDPAALAVAERSPVAGSHRLVRCGIGAQPAPCVTWVDGELVACDVPRADGTALRGSTVIAQAEDLRMPGDHNRRNAAVAAALAIVCGAEPVTIAGALRSFEGKALRLQQLDTIDGVEVWSDLKSTTPEATIAALDALAGRRIVLIAGGADKGLDYAPLAATIAAGDVHVLAVPGSATDALEHALEAHVAAPEDLFERATDLADALDRGFDVAASGDVVIVSPAAAGFWTQELQGGSSLRSLIQRRAQQLSEGRT